MLWAGPVPVDGLPKPFSSPSPCGLGSRCADGVSLQPQVLQARHLAQRKGQGLAPGCRPADQRSTFISLTRQTNEARSLAGL